jgi:hypothetical protein
MNWKVFRRKRQYSGIAYRQPGKLLENLVFEPDNSRIIIKSVTGLGTLLGRLLLLIFVD